MMDTPLLSIVVANYNYGRFLDEAIKSVLSQSCQDFELILIDGASKDNSIDVIHRYVENLPQRTCRDVTKDSCKIAYWVSEKDTGQSNAFNKGFAQAHGRFLTWLNADDVMLPGTIAKLKSASQSYPDCEWFVGGCLWLDPEMRVIKCGRGRPFSELRFQEGVVGVWGPSSFFSQRLLKSVGGVDERLHFSMDADLWLKFASKLNVRYRPFCKYAWGLRLHPDAKMSGHNFSTDGKLDKTHSEAEQRASSKHFKQMQFETALRSEYFTAKKKRLWRRILSIRWVDVIAARLDLMKWRNKRYNEIQWD